MAIPFSILDAAHAMGRASDPRRRVPRPDPNEVAKKGGDALGIYELDGDNLKVACVGGTWTEKKWRGRPRPTQFRLPDAEIVIELRRVKAVK
jgi:hypothetical protein